MHADPNGLSAYCNYLSRVLCDKEVVAAIHPSKMRRLKKAVAEGIQIIEEDDTPTESKEEIKMKQKRRKSLQPPTPPLPPPNTP